MREWLPGQNAPLKWNEVKKDLKAGDVVLVISPDQPRARWPLGRIIEIYTGQDQHVRVAKVQVGQNSYLRPISKLVSLEVI